MEIEVLDEVDSTSSYLVKRADLLKKNFFSVRAINQTRGRGRLGRKWRMMPGRDLAFSMVYHPLCTNHRSHASVLTGIAIARAIAQHMENSLSIKWPNDILAGGKKICGILCEYFDTGTIPVVIIGVGININSDSFPDGLDKTSISMCQITGKEHDIDAVFYGCIRQMRGLLECSGDFLSVEIVEEWMRLSSDMGRDILFESDGKNKKGKIAGLDNHGRILIETEGGIIAYAGELQ